MKQGDRRALTKGERAIAASVFGAHFDPDPCRIRAEAHLLTRWSPRPLIMVRGTDIWWPLPAPGDCAIATRPALMALFVHELVHLWQYQSGRFSVLAYAATLAPLRYHYRLSGARGFLSYGYEQQAAIGEDYWRLLHGLAPRWALGAVMPVSAYARLLAETFPGTGPARVLAEAGSGPHPGGST